MKQSEYSVVERLHRTPVQISLLSLVLRSEPHRRTQAKVLNEAHVAHDVSTEKFGNLVGQIHATNYITFTDDEIDPGGTGHLRSLHITVKCKDNLVAKVMLSSNYQKGKGFGRNLKGASAGSKAERGASAGAYTR